jgi:plasmid stabilization system protein ParE
MNYQLLVSQEARLDIFDAFLWYENQRDNLGFEFEKSLDEGFQKILMNPQAIQRHYDSVHIHFIDRFPYGIHYLINDNTIRVFGVFHTSRGPNKWTARFQ